MKKIIRLGLLASLTFACHPCLCEAAEPLPKLVSTAPAAGLTGQPIPVWVKTSGRTSGEGTMVMISHVPAGATLSTGLNLGGGTWLIAPEYLGSLHITFARPGDFRLEAQALSEQLQAVSAPSAFTVSVHPAKSADY